MPAPFWNELGFRDDVFFVRPLAASLGDLPMFVGREKETARFLAGLARSSRGLLVVGGETGVGKTSFANMQQYLSYSGRKPDGLRKDFPVPRLLPSYSKIQLTEDDDLNSVLLRAVSQLVKGVINHCNIEHLEIPAEAKVIDQWCNQAIVVSGGGGGLSTPFGGISVAKGTRSVNVNVTDVRSYLERLAALIVHDLKLAGSLVSLNNLDTLPNEYLAKFLNAARDVLFDIPYIFWTLIGNEGLGSFIQMEAGRVAEYLSTPEITLRPLDAEHFSRIVAVREETLRKSEDVALPLDRELLPTIYALAGNELRAALQLAGDILVTVRLEFPSTTRIDFELFRRFLSQVSMYRFDMANPTASQKKVLTTLLRRDSARPRDHKLFGFESAATFLPHLRTLLTKRLISRVQDGKATFYKPTGMTVLAAAGGALGEDTRRLVMSKLGSAFDSAMSPSPPVTQTEMPMVNQLTLFRESQRRLGDYIPRSTSEDEEEDP